jgi:hypothetical protein
LGCGVIAYASGINLTKEIAMTNCVIIGKRLLPLEHIALVEPFDRAAHPRMQTEKAFQARVVLIDRESVLTEEAPEAYVRTHGFRMLADEGVTINPAVKFGVETFAAAEGFTPAKPYRSRLSWRDRDGNTQSKLLLTEPQTAVAIAVQGVEAPTAETADAPEAAAKQPARASRRRTRLNASSLRPSS